MYRYDEYDSNIIADRVRQFRGQTQRYLEGKLGEEEFRPLRLQNGLYVQRLAPMLRVSIPYGLLNGRQLRTLARLSRDYDKGYGHFTTRQNIQFNWPHIEDVPQLLAELAEVEMHAMQTSGNCIRNITTDHLAGVAREEITDPRPYCELIRQWACLHPEFSYLPRKFKISVTASPHDRAAIRVHDIGLRILRDEDGAAGFAVFVGGGLGRTPVVGPLIRSFLPEEQLLNYLEAILRVYNRFGRRDNRYKSRIKILVRALGVEAFTERVEREWEQLRDSPQTLGQEEIARVGGQFSPPPYRSFDATEAAAQLAQIEQREADFATWVRNNTAEHRVAGYAVVFVSLKTTGLAPGDISDTQLEALADLAQRYSFDELRVSHEQNLVLADVPMVELFPLWGELRRIRLDTANIGALGDIVCCPGGDFCSLANAKSIPLAEAIQRRFQDEEEWRDLGALDINISGCMNACGHHHVGHIGILGVDKKGQEFFQVQLGGDSGEDASLGTIIGPSFPSEEVPAVVATILREYRSRRRAGERFLDTYRRVGVEPFKAAVYGAHN